MGFFTPKCPRCGGALQSTGYSAPYPSHQCPNCIAASQREREIRELRDRVQTLEAKEPKP